MFAVSVAETLILIGGSYIRKLRPKQERTAQISLQIVNMYSSPIVTGNVPVESAFKLSPKNRLCSVR